MGPMDELVKELANIEAITSTGGPRLANCIPLSKLLGESGDPTAFVAAPPGSGSTGNLKRAFRNPLPHDGRDPVAPIL